MRMRLIFFVIALTGLISCGSSGEYAYDVPTDAPPIISRVDPASGAPGSQATIFGFGYSYIVTNDIITMGTEGVVPTQYTLLANPTSTEIESLTFNIPGGLAPGDYAIVLVVNGNPSNSDIIFTVTGS